MLLINKIYQRNVQKDLVNYELIKLNLLGMKIPVKT